MRFYGPSMAAKHEMDQSAEFDALIEIPSQALPVKYELDKDEHLLRVDRFLSTAMIYPCNYGYLPGTLAADGDPLDVLVPTPYPLIPACLIRVRPVAVLFMEDEKGEDEKVVAVPVRKLTPAYESWRDLADVPEWWRVTVSHFFEQYKAHEPGKFVRVREWGGLEKARATIASAYRAGNP